MKVHHFPAHPVASSLVLYSWLFFNRFDNCSLMRCSFTATWFLDIPNTPAISLFSKPSRCIEIMARPVSDNSLIACCKRAPLLFEYPNFQLLVIKAPANLYNLYAVFFFLKWRWYLNRCGTARCWTSHLLCRMASLSRHSAILPETCLFFFGIICI